MQPINHQIYVLKILKFSIKCVPWATNTSYSFLGNDTSLPADNPFPVKENLTEQNIKQKESIKTLGGKIKDEKIRKTENRKIARISGL